MDNPTSPTPAAPSRTEQDNRMVWDGRPGHYEVWYLTLSQRARGAGWWIRHVIESPRAGDGEPYAQLWFSRFDPGAGEGGVFGVNHKFHIADFAAVAEPFSVEIAGSVARHDGWRVVFESVSVKLKRGQIILPTITLMSLHLDGEEIAFRDPWRLPLARSTWQTGRYHLVGATPDTRVEAEFTCTPDETLLAEYVDPD